MARVMLNVDKWKRFYMNIVSLGDKKAKKYYGI